MTPLGQVLTEAGLNELQAAIWEEFIVASFSALRAAQTRLSDPLTWASAIKKKGFLAKGQGRLLEPGVTAEMWHHLKNVTRAADEQDPLKRLRIQFFHDPPLPSSSRTGTRSKKADILAMSADSQQELFLYFEAKFLGTASDVTTYTGPNGVRRWTDVGGSYRNERWGAMIGYATCAVTPSWGEQISAALTSGSLAGVVLDQVRVAKERESVLLSWLARDAQGDRAAVFHLQFEFPAPQSRHVRRPSIRRGRVRR